MRRRRRMTGTEINLTSLLDVLFCVLFIVMLTGQQVSEASQQENDDLKEQIVEYENQQTVYDSFNTDVVFLSMGNLRMGGGKHTLIMKVEESEDTETITLGTDLTENTKNRVISFIDNAAKESDGKLVYIAFNCNKHEIYSAEYDAVCTALKEAQDKYKNVFYKIVEE